VRRMLEEASAQVTQQAEALSSMGSDADEKAAELASAQEQLSNAIASLDSANASVEQQTHIIQQLQMESTGDDDLP
jgi:chromosome segregation ATPase